MNAINYALSIVNRVIPQQILHLAFVENNDLINQVISLDERISSTVIRPRILVDCNLVGGIMTKIPVNKCNIITLQNNEFIIEVPKLLTNNKSIINVLSLVSNVTTGFNGYMQNDSQLLAAAYKMYNNVGTEPVVQYTHDTLYGQPVSVNKDDDIIKVLAKTEKSFKGSKIHFNIEGPKLTLTFSGHASGIYEDTYEDTMLDVVCNYDMIIVFEIINSELYVTSETYNLTDGHVTYTAGGEADEVTYTKAENLSVTYTISETNWIGETYNDLINLFKTDIYHYITLDFLEPSINIEDKYLQCVTSDHKIKY